MLKQKYFGLVVQFVVRNELTQINKVLRVRVEYDQLNQRAGHRSLQTTSRYIESDSVAQKKLVNI